MRGRKVTVWTKSKVSYLKRHYATTPIRELAEKLGKTDQQIYAMRKRLGLRKDPAFLSEERSRLMLEEARKARLRLKWGLPTKIKVCLKPFTTQECMTRKRLLGHGYILGDLETERKMVFYDKDTRRVPRTERTAMRQGFRFEELEE